MKDEKEIKELLKVIYEQNYGIEPDEALSDFGWIKYLATLTAIRKRKDCSVVDKLLEVWGEDPIGFRNWNASFLWEFTPDQAKMVLITMEFASLQFELEDK